MDTSNITPASLPPSSAKKSSFEGFFQFGVFAVFYFALYHFTQIAFTLLDYLFPAANNNYYSEPSVSFSLATVIVLTPLLVWLMRYAGKRAERDPGLMYHPVRRFFIYATVALTIFAIAGDLITVLYLFLDGQDLTVSFLLKVAFILVLAVLIFSYYVKEVRTGVPQKQRTLYAVVITTFAVLEVIATFAILGTPHTRQLKNYDNQKISDLATIQNNVIEYWRSNAALPTSLDTYYASKYLGAVPTDPETNTAYTYTPTGPTTFKLCATFNFEDMTNRSGGYYYGDPSLGGWKHGKGNYCFDRTINPDQTKPYTMNAPQVQLQKI